MAGTWVDVLAWCRLIMLAFASAYTWMMNHITGIGKATFRLQWPCYPSAGSNFLGLVLALDCPFWNPPTTTRGSPGHKDMMHHGSISTTTLRVKQPQHHPSSPSLAMRLYMPYPIYHFMLSWFISILYCLMLDKTMLMTPTIKTAQSAHGWIARRPLIRCYQVYIPIITCLRPSIPWVL